MRISDWSSDVCSSDLGKIERIPDLDTFPQGCPPGARLPSYPCGEWGGFVWYSLNPDVEPLEQYLDPMPQHLNPYHMERMARSEEHTSELQSLMRISYAVFCLKKKKTSSKHTKYYNTNPTLNEQKKTKTPITKGNLYNTKRET